MDQRVILCATNAGGAKNLLPLAELLFARRVPMLFAFSGGVKHLIPGHLRRAALCLPEKPPQRLLLRLLSEPPASLLLVGTTCYASPDRALTRLARKRGVRTVAVLDEWYNYALRFRGSRGHLDFLPHAIAAMDAAASAEAQREGIPRRLLHVTGSPALTALHGRGRAYLRRPPTPPPFLRRPGKRTIITFLSEEFAADYRTGRSQRRLGPFQGFDENGVLRDITEALRGIHRDFLLVEKLHPSSSRRETNRPADLGNVRYLRVKEADLPALLWHSGVVVGMRSIALLEAAMLGRPCASYQPGLRFPNQCAAVKRGVAPLLKDRTALAGWLRRHCGAHTQRRRRRLWPFVSDESSRRILALGGIDA